jgi:CDP-paratose 2-epimerase
MRAVANSARQRAPRRVLITGGCGFIGSNLADALAARGEEVVVLDAMTREGSQENASWLKSRWQERIEVLTADVRDGDAMRMLVRDCSAVLHLAGQVAVTSSLEDPLTDFSVNALGTLNLLESLRHENPLAPLIFASTNKVYGGLTCGGEIGRSSGRYSPVVERLSHGVSEATPLDLYSPYGCSKGAADQYVHDYARVFGLRTVVLRMSCIYGPRQFGTEDQGWLAHFMIKALSGEPITLYGDGYQVRDALYVDDAVAAWLAARDRIASVSGGIFNLGGGLQNAISLREAIDRIATYHGVAPELRFADWRPGDQPWYVSDIRAISAALDWSPGVSLSSGLKQLYEWISSRVARRAAGAALQKVAV